MSDHAEKGSEEGEGGGESGGASGGEKSGEREEPPEQPAGVPKDEARGAMLETRVLTHIRVKTPVARSRVKSTVSSPGGLETRSSAQHKGEASQAEEGDVRDEATASSSHSATRKSRLKSKDATAEEAEVAEANKSQEEPQEEPSREEAAELEDGDQVKPKGTSESEANESEPRASGVSGGGRKSGLKKHPSSSTGGAEPESEADAREEELLASRSSDTVLESGTIQQESTRASSSAEAGAQTEAEPEKEEVGNEDEPTRAARRESSCTGGAEVGADEEAEA